MSTETKSPATAAVSPDAAASKAADTSKAQAAAAAPAETQKPAETKAAKPTFEQASKSLVQQEFAKAEAAAAAQKPAEDAKKVAEAKAADTKAAETAAAEKRTSLLQKPTEAKKPDATAAAADTLPTIPDNAPQAVKDNFAALRKVAEDRRAEADALKAQLATFKTAQPADVAEVDRLKAEHKAALDRLAMVDLQSHPDFLRKYAEPKKAALKEAGEVLAYSGKEGVDLGLLLSKPMKDFNAEVSKLTEGMNVADAQTVLGSLRSAYKLANEERGELSRAGERVTQLQQVSAHQQKQIAEEVWNKIGAAGDALVKIEAPDGATPEQIKDVTEYNMAVDQVRVKYEQAALGKVDERGAAAMAAKAVILDHLTTHAIPRMEREYASLVEDNKRLAQELAAVKGSRSVGAVVGDHGATGGGSGAAPKTIRDLPAFREAFPRSR